MYILWHLLWIITTPPSWRDISISLLVYKAIAVSLPKTCQSCIDQTYYKKFKGISTKILVMLSENDKHHESDTMLQIDLTVILRRMLFFKWCFIILFIFHWSLFPCGSKWQQVGTGSGKSLATNRGQAKTYTNICCIKPQWFNVCQYDVKQYRMEYWWQTGYHNTLFLSSTNINAFQEHPYLKMKWICHIISKSLLNSKCY